MKQAHQYEQEANHNLQQAARLLETIDALGNPKMLLGILSHIHTAQQAVVSFFSTYISKKQHTTYEDSLDAFLKEASSHQLLSSSEQEQFVSTHALMKKYKESPMAFSRKESFVIASQDYNLSLLEVPSIKRCLLATKIVTDKVFGHD